MRLCKRSLYVAAALAVLFPGGIARAARIKDLASLRGVRDNQLTGYGIVVGLQGTGDKDFDLTATSLGLVLKGLGVTPRSEKLVTKNAAAVFVSAMLPPFAREGSKLDVTVSSIGSATSLDGGTLMMTALKGPDGNVYAMAQGKIVTMQRGDNASKASGQTLVTASVPQGALLEKEVQLDLAQAKVLRYQLYSPDFTTAARVARRINEELGGRYASAIDAGTVEVLFPYSFEGSPVELIAQIEGIDVEADRRAKVVINQRTGTVILGGDVKVLPVAIAHNNLRIEVRDDAPAANAGTKSTKPATSDRKVTSTTIKGGKRAAKVMVMRKGTSIADIAAALNEMGAGADDLISLIQSLKAAGALVADLEIQ